MVSGRLLLFVEFFYVLELNFTNVGNQILQQFDMYLGTNIHGRKLIFCYEERIVFSTYDRLELVANLVGPLLD